MFTPNGKSRLDLVKEGMNPFGRLPKRGQFVVSISKLVEDPDNERRTFRDMDGLIASVKRHGIVEPITVSEKDGVFHILTGHRRFRAAQAAGMTEIEVIARAPEDALTRRRKSIVSNVQREDIGVIEMAEALQTLLDSDDSITTQRQLASVIGKTEQWVSAMLSVLRLPASLQEKLKTSQVTISYDSAMKIGRCEDPALQKELVQAALEGESVREIRERITRSKAPASGDAPAGKRGSRESAPMLTFYETCEGYTASVRGPEGVEAKRHMRAALEQLLRKI